MALRATGYASGELGELHVIARPPGGSPVDVTMFRGVPVMVDSFSHTDPFGPSSASLSVSQVSIHEALGTGDTVWIAGETDIDLVLVKPDGTRETWWSGYVASMSWGLDDTGSTVSVECKGALLQGDAFLAKPVYLRQPITYERAIARQFEIMESLRCLPLVVEWPEGWKKTYQARSDLAWYQQPADISAGDRWTGMLTRTTGSWDPALTGYVQSLLSSMWTEKGQWTIVLREGRQPVLMHRDTWTPSDLVYEVSVVSPGLQLSLSEDWTQSANAVYGQGKSLDGVSFSGVSYGGGGRIYYEPLAQMSAVNSESPFYDQAVARKEVSVTVQEGLTRGEAAEMARMHLRKYARPGLTGSITLGSDLTRGGKPVSRFQVRAGERIRVRGLFGSPQGTVFHISESSVGLDGGQVTLTVDTKFRDALTVSEVNQRGRDSLAVTRGIIAGAWQPPVSDMLFPWSDEAGSGVVPSGAVVATETGYDGHSAREFFLTMPDSVRFPWTGHTKVFPPSRYEPGGDLHGKAAMPYVRINAPSATDPNVNWSVTDHLVDDLYHSGYPVLMSQSGNINTVLVAAYDSNGDVMKVPFHFSLWWANSSNEESTPWVRDDSVFPPGVSFPDGSFYPFTKGGWDTFKADGTQVSPDDTSLAYEGSQKVQAWGVYGARAGFYPGKDNADSSSTEATGLFVDTSGFSFQATEQFDVYNDLNIEEPQRVTMCALFYCDAHVGQPVYFLGKLFSDPPGGK